MRKQRTIERERAKEGARGLKEVRHGVDIEGF